MGRTQTRKCLCSCPMGRVHTAGCFSSLWLLVALTEVAVNASSQRIRRELRTLNDTERLAVFSALDTMKKTSTADGQALYGAHFISYDELVAKHLSAAADPRCDQAHLGPAFATYHRIFTLQFELSLLSIDPSIHALPYWDYNVEANMTNPRLSKMWSADWFGSSEGDPARGNAIFDGFFASWRVRSNATDISRHASPFNLLRSPWNNNPSLRLTRFAHSCGSSTELNPRMWERCLSAPGYMLWYACQDPTIHTWAHSFLGGIWSSPHNLTRIECYLENAVAVPELWGHGCANCPDNCTVGSQEQCLCAASKAARCLAGRVVSPTSTYGDFADSWTSPNDPIFFFHHANVDRNLMTWQLRHSAQAPRYGFPGEWLPCSGHGYEDVIASNWSFDAASLLGEEHHRPLKNADIIGMNASNSPYIYDTLTKEDDYKI